MTVGTIFTPGLFIFSAVLLASARDLPHQNLVGDELLEYLSKKQSSFEVKNYGWNEKQQKASGMPATADQPMKVDSPPNLDHITLDMIPESFDSRDQWPHCESIRRILDQSQCGSCYAICTTGIMADRLCIHSNKQVQISVVDVMSCCPECGGGCLGGDSMKTLKRWVTHGFVTGGANSDYHGCQNYPFPPCAVHGYSECPCSGYTTPQCNQTCHTGYSNSYTQDKTFAYLISGDVIHQNTVIAIQKEILINGPVKATFDMYPDFYPYVSGVYMHMAGTKKSRHCVKIIGWGTENGTPYWLIANTFGSFWGEQGFVKFLRGANECGIEAAVGAALPAILTK